MNLTDCCRRYIGRLLNRENLSENDIEALFHTLLSNNKQDLTDEESTVLAGLLVVPAMKGKSVSKLAGAARGMCRHAKRIQVIDSPVVDIVGTGGDFEFFVQIHARAGRLFAVPKCRVEYFDGTHNIQCTISAAALQPAGVSILHLLHIPGMRLERISIYSGLNYGQTVVPSPSGRGLG